MKKRFSVYKAEAKIKEKERIPKFCWKTGREEICNTCDCPKGEYARAARRLEKIDKQV